MEYSIASPSQAHTMGNISAVMTEFVKNMFPKDYFKTVNISSQVAFRQFNIMRAGNRDFIKRGKPMLIIRPRFDMDLNDTFMANTLLTNRMTDNIYESDFGNLQPFVYDKEGETAIKFLLNRIKMYFDVTILVESQMEQMNMAFLLKNTVRQDRPFFMDLFLENHIPREVIRALATDKKISMDDIPTLLKYLNENTAHPVTYKMKNSTGNDEFFRHYKTKVDTIISGLQIDDGTKKNMVDDVYTISFTIGAEYWAAGLFYYFTRNPSTIMDMRSEPNTGSSIIPLHTPQVFNMFPVPQGWDKYTAVAYKVDDSGQPFKLNFDVLLNSSLKSVFNYLRDNNLRYDGVFDVVIERDSEILKPGDYTIDYATRTLTTYKVNTTSTYRFNLLMNTAFVNDLIIDKNGFNDEK